MRKMGAGAVLAQTAARLGTFVVAAAAMALVPATAHAEDDANVRAARELYRQAMDDQDAHRYEDALSKLRQVASVKTTPAVHFYIAYNEEKLGRLVAALNDMTAAESELAELADAKNGGASSDAAKLLPFAKDELKALDARVPRLAVEMDRTAKDATLTIDGAPISSSLWPKIHVLPGAHHLVARASGRADDARDVSAAEGQTVVVSFASASSAAANGTPGAATTATTASQGGAASTSPAGSEPASHGHAFAIAATAGAAALLAGGIVAYVIAGSDANDAEARCAAARTCDPSRGAIRTWDALALTGFIGSAALVSVAIVSWARSGADDPKPYAKLFVGPGRAGIEGSF